MDRQIQAIGTAFLIGFAILAGGAGYWQVVRAPHRPGGYRVTLATGRSYTPWVRRVEVE
jgi:hypothetical protein